MARMKAQVSTTNNIDENRGDFSINKARNAKIIVTVLLAPIITKGKITREAIITKSNIQLSTILIKPEKCLFTSEYS